MLDRVMGGCAKPLLHRHCFDQSSPIPAPADAGPLNAPSLTQVIVEFLAELQNGLDFLLYM